MLNFLGSFVPQFILHVGSANFYVPRCPSFSHYYIDDLFARRHHNYLVF